MIKNRTCKNCFNSDNGCAFERNDWKEGSCRFLISQERPHDFSRKEKEIYFSFDYIYWDEEVPELLHREFF